MRSVPPHPLNHRIFLYTSLPIPLSSASYLSTPNPSAKSWKSYNVIPRMEKIKIQPICHLTAKIFLRHCCVFHMVVRWHYTCRFSLFDYVRIFFWGSPTRRYLSFKEFMSFFWLVFLIPQLCPVPVFEHANIACSRALFAVY